MGCWGRLQACRLVLVSRQVLQLLMCTTGKLEQRRLVLQMSKNCLNELFESDPKCTRDCFIFLYLTQYVLKLFFEVWVVLVVSFYIYDIILKGSSL
jgi:hypothetical protein